MGPWMRCDDKNTFSSMAKFRSNQNVDSEKLSGGGVAAAVYKKPATLCD
jgi:hypothetical protein